MKELLDFQQTRDLLYKIQVYDKNFKWTPVDLDMKEFMFYVLMKHDSKNPEKSYELIVNKIVNVSQQYFYKDFEFCKVLHSAILKDLLCYYENNNENIKVDKYNVDLMQNFANQCFNDNQTNYFINNFEHKNIDDFFVTHKSWYFVTHESYFNQKNQEAIIRRRRKLKADSDASFAIKIVLGCFLFLLIVFWISNYQ